MEGPLTAPPSSHREPHPGLCADCRHARPITSARGSTFWRCSLSDADPTFPKYPRLPVTTCAGFTALVAALDSDKLSATERDRADEWQ